MRRLRKWFKKYFIPHKENHHRPHFLRHKSMLTVLVGVILLELLLLFQVFIVLDKTGFLASVLPGVLTSLTNEERASNDALPLKENALLVEAAKQKAQDMATYGYFAHTSPDGKTPWYWLEKVGYSYEKAGENLAVNFFDSRDVAVAWMNSPSHRANIVKPEYTEIGIGVAEGKYEGKNTIFVAQFFGTPLLQGEFVSNDLGPLGVVTKPETKVEVKKDPVSETVIPKSNSTPSSTQVLGEEEITPRNAPAEIEKPNKIKSFVAKILSSPGRYVSYAFGAVIGLIILTLGSLLFVKGNKHHPLLVVRGVLIMSVVLLLVSLNTKLFDKSGEIAREDISLSAIDF